VVKRGGPNSEVPKEKSIRKNGLREYITGKKARTSLLNLEEQGKIDVGSVKKREKTRKRADELGKPGREGPPG